MSFVKRKIDVTIQLGQGAFGTGGYDTVKLSGLRVSANIVKGALPTFDSSELRIWGLTPTILNKVSTLGKTAFYDRVNTVIIEAGDDTAGMTVVYQGNIRDAFQEVSGPSMGLNIVSNVGLVSNTKPIPPVSYPGRVSVVTIMSDLAARMTPPLAFENNGVSVILTTPYYPGTAIDQFRQIKAHADIEAAIDNGVLVIWPKGGSRTGLIPRIAPDTGLVGYPKFSGTGFISLQTLFMPGLRLGGQFKLETGLQPAPGQYQSCGLVYELESETPDGKWFADITAFRPEVQTK